MKKLSLIFFIFILFSSIAFAINVGKDAGIVNKGFRVGGNTGFSFGKQAVNNAIYWRTARTDFWNYARTGLWEVARDADVATLTHLVYDDNDATSGTVPNPIIYESGATAIILDNTGTLAKDGYTFSGWNTAANGSGTDYAAAATFEISGDTTLYAKWILSEYIAKSVIVDIADGWNELYYGVRSIDFYNNGELIAVTSEDFTAYDSAHYTTYSADNAFDTSLSKTGPAAGPPVNSWWQFAGSAAKLLCVFDSPITFDSVVINNYHVSGSDVTQGVKNIEIYISDDVEDIEDSVDGLGKIFDGQIRQHVALDQAYGQELLRPDNTVAPVITGTFAEDETLTCSTGTWDNSPTGYTYQWKADGTNISGATSSTYMLTAGDIDAVITCLVTASNTFGATIALSNEVIYLYSAKSVIIDIADNWGGSYMNLRAIEFLVNSSLIQVTSGFTAYNTSQFGASGAANAFNTSLSKTGDYGNGWLSNSAATSQRIIIVFDSEISFSDIVANNGHHFGEYTEPGVKNIKIYISTNAITSTVYNEAIANSTLIFDGQLAQHVAADTADDQVLELE